ncbi:putative repeat protein (TIGR02543 family) [Paenibacillus sp. JGP012]|uniref:tail fiber protein n=1 Tax=Paenibacillus sp. JGP012 TaxID=2735914 RepID=UPI001607AA71|nr:tail fiber protein [Paenibacillus sp. JGP012]MBB6022140.1 putative repeat protein (TIGR02543 family) [Paenibacillus sp. JGP012]
MIQHACRVFWKITLVFVLTFTTCSLGNGTTRLAHAAANQPYVGEIQLFPYNFAPEGWTFAAGQTLSIQSNSTLFSLIGTWYGGDGKDNFSLPNLTSLPVPDGMGYYISTGGLFPPREEGMVSNALAGEVRMFPYAFVPSGWLKLDGSKHRSLDYPRLYDTIGSAFGSSDGETFTLPSVEIPIPDTKLFFAVAATTSAEQNGNDIGNGTGYELIGETIPFLVPMQTTWEPSDGRLVSLMDNQELFSLLGEKFGGDGTRQFGVPNMSNNPYAFQYYIVKNGGYPRRVDGGSVPGELAGTSTIYTVPSGQSVQIYSSDLLGNASGSGASGVSLRTQPQHGTVSDRGNGFTYTAASNYSGDDSFTVRTYNNNGFASGYSTIRIKVEAPVPPAVSGVSDGGIYNGTVTPGFTNGKATLNGSEYLNGTPIGSEGSYTLVVTNNYGTTTVSFTIDLTPPTVDGVRNGARYTEPPTITFSDGNAKLNGEAFKSGSQVSQEGSYTLIVTDEANNSSTLTFSYYAPRQLLFDSGGGSSVDKQEVYYGDHGIEPTAPTRTGYTFTGWFTDTQLTVPFDFSEPIQSNVTLYAGWKPVTTPGGGSNSGNNGNGGTGSSGNGGSSESGGGSGSNSNSNSALGTENNASNSTSDTQVNVSIAAGQAAEIKLGTGMQLQVPAGAANQQLEIKAIVVNTPLTGLNGNMRVVSQVYEFTKNMQGNFGAPVKLTLSFDPTSLSSNEKLAVFYQNQPNTPWIMVEGGVIKGNTISVDVNHFTRFAVMAVPAADASPIPAKGDFSDISGHWAASTIRQAAELGIVKGYADGTFHPGAPVTRAEFTAMLVRMLKPATEHIDTDSASPVFSDMAQIGAWAREDVALASALGWIQGDMRGNFRANASITRAEMAVMVSRAMAITDADAEASFTDVATIPAWAIQAAAQLQQSGIMKGRVNGAFDSSAPLTRAEATQVLMRAEEMKFK